jgi:TonB family protein
MKKYCFLSIIFILQFHNTIAQKTYRTIYQDTINLRGIVLDSYGKPVPKVRLASKNLDAKTKTTLYTTTDSAGKFKLSGAMPNDTLYVYGTTMGMWVYNKGSRYMEITLPGIKLQQINALNPIVITTIKKNTRKKIPVNLEVSDDVCFDCGIGGGLEYNAAYPGGATKFAAYIKSRLSYPEQAIKSGIEGTVEISFMVNKDGSLSDFKILQGLGYGCDDAVIDILKNSPKWKPGISNGHALVSPQSITIQFKLTDK